MKCYSLHIRKYQSSHMSTLRRIIPVKSSECTICFCAFDGKPTLFDGKIRTMRDVFIIAFSRLLLSQNENPLITTTPYSLVTEEAKSFFINPNNCYFLSVLGKQQNKSLQCCYY